jgi:hypothetical protein
MNKKTSGLKGLSYIDRTFSAGRLRALSAGLLVQPDNVSCGVAEARGDLRRIGADRLSDLAAIGDDRVPATLSTMT